MDILAQMETLSTYFNSLSAASWPNFMYFYLANKAGLSLPDETFVVETNDGLKIEMRENKLGDIETFLELFLGQPYFTRLPKSTKNKARPTVLDIGAHISLFSLYACKTLKMPVVYAYEPDKSNFNLMKRNIKANNLIGRVKPFNLAVSGTEGEVKLWNSNNPVLFSTLKSAAGGHKKDEYTLVASTKLSRILKKLGHVDIMKMDCEGSEWEIIRDMRDLEFDIDYICMEYHEINGRKRGEMVNYLVKKGFEVTLRDKDKNRGTGILFATRA